MSSRNYSLKGETRDQGGKGVARALRRENKVPGVVYGGGKDPLSISLSSKEINLEYNKGHMYTSLCNLEVGGEKHLLLARDVQLHPVTDNVLHVDFLRVTPKTKIHVRVPVKFVNQEECPGLKEKGVLNVVLHDLDLVCLATDIPDHIDIDLSKCNLGDSIKLSDLTLPKGVTTDSVRDATIASVNAPRRVVEEAPVAAEGAEGADKAEGAAEGEKKE